MSIMSELNKQIPSNRFDRNSNKRGFNYTLKLVPKILNKNQVVGSGKFGVVKRALLNGCEVALKIYGKRAKNSESEESKESKEEFKKELRQLWRLSHHNIVSLIGFIKNDQLLALVEEYAEEGSLYDVLHSEMKIEYRLWHVISWLLQCSRGIAYMHSVQPKAILHRDLKSLNLVLSKRATLLKICDFNTVCDLRSIMSMTKGSAPWMAPEVFKTYNYTEKCDVFSWAIILWELLTRTIPWQQLKDFPLEAILLAVGFGKRPPLIYDCPKLIENLMIKCWSQDPNDRPSMRELELIVEQYFKLCPKPENGIYLEIKRIEEKYHSVNNEGLDLQKPIHFMDLLKRSETPESVDDFTPQQFVK